MDRRGIVLRLLGRHARSSSASPGLALFLYLLIHIAGNLIVFLGPATFNKYAFTLESNPLLPIIELVLLLLFLIHISRPSGCTCANQAGAAGGLRAEEVGRRAQPQVASRPPR